MIIKKIVTITLGASLVLMALILIAGVLVPTSVLEKIGGKKNSGNTQAVALDANGKPIAGATVKVNADGTKTVTDQNGNVIASASVANSAGSPAVAGATSSSTTSSPAPTVAATAKPATNPAPVSTPKPTAAPTPPPPPAPVYCGGSSPCYGPSTLNAHKSTGDCWAYNGNRVINITSFNNAFHKNKLNLLPSTSLCGAVNLAPYLGGTSFNGKSQNHSSSAKNNTNGSVSPYFVGYYDASKP